MLHHPRYINIFENYNGVVFLGPVPLHSGVLINFNLTVSPSFNLIFIVF